MVRATPGQTGNRIAYLVPTASYMAYANEHMPTDAPLAQLLTDQVAVLRKNDVFLSEHREYGNSCYDVHSDGAGVCYTSRLRPILNMRPKYRSWLGGRGSALWQFNADTHVTDWLEAAGYGYDCLSDETCTTRARRRWAITTCWLPAAIPSTGPRKCGTRWTHFAVGAGASSRWAATPGTGAWPSIPRCQA